MSYSCNILCVLKYCCVGCISLWISSSSQAPLWEKYHNRKWTQATYKYQVFEQLEFCHKQISIVFLWWLEEFQSHLQGITNNLEYFLVYTYKLNTPGCLRNQRPNLEFEKWYSEAIDCDTKPNQTSCPPPSPTPTKEQSNKHYIEASRQLLLTDITYQNPSPHKDQI